MGRRKIEIKAIKDDRNRSVTFLKRKGGLFKKAHELSVLCSVDVTVIIFGHNKKLYEFSSGDIRETLGRYQYYGPPHEHKGPEDFAGKKEPEEGEEEDDATPAPDDRGRRSQTRSIPPGVPAQQAFQHVNDTPAASPPISNGAQYHRRNGTPQPTAISRPSSRNNVQRVHPSALPQQQQHHSTPPPQAAQNGYAYMQHPNMYNPQVNPNMPHQPMRQPQYPYSRPPTSQPQLSQAPMNQHPPNHSIHLHHHHPHQYHQQPQQHPPHHIPHHPPPQHQPYSHAAHHINSQGNPRRQSMPPAFPQQERQMPHPDQTSQSEHLQVKNEHNNSPPGIKPLPPKSRGIFTPIDDHRSVLAQLAFGPPPEKIEPKEESQTTTETKKNLPPAPAAPPPVKPIRSLPEPQRTQSMSSIHSLQSGPKQRGPRLTVQIPSENSDAGSGTAGSSPKDGNKNTSLTPAKEGPHSAVVLPPPSPSASALLSAGASGPPNPFARPPPPGTTAPGNVDTPMSALPSRFVSDTLLPSPSLFYSEWGFGRSGPDSNMLPSPLTFPTPVVPTAPGFSREADDSDKKRKSPDSGANDNAASKRLKTD